VRRSYRQRLDTVNAVFKVEGDPNIHRARRGVSPLDELVIPGDLRVAPPATAGAQVRRPGNLLRRALDLPGDVLERA